MESEMGSVPQGETEGSIEKLQRDYAVKWLATMKAAEAWREVRNDPKSIEAQNRLFGLQSQLKSATEKARELYGENAEKILAEAASKYNIETESPDADLVVEADKFYNEWGKET